MLSSREGSTSTIQSSSSKNSSITITSVEGVIDFIVSESFDWFAVTLKKKHQIRKKLEGREGTLHVPGSKRVLDKEEAEGPQSEARLQELGLALGPSMRRGSKKRRGCTPSKTKKRPKLVRERWK